MDSSKLAIFGVVAILSGCAAIPHTFTTQWSEETLPEVAPMEGDNTISGSAFLRQGGGGTVTCAGNDVALKRDLNFLRSPYAEEVNSLSVSVREASAVDPRHHEFESKLAQLTASQSMRTSCDVDGKFEFSNLAPGQYKITTKVYWVVANEGQGGLVSSIVSIPEGSAGKTYNTVVSKLSRNCSFTFLDCSVP